ncbi:C4-dicarboxylate TRAP transporter substrate-binding protein [uncultured Sneathiella sp.]|uniref:C4-dicarboxylate TRAP transporter substrate-binding protein n=1 Tax=uncultured Sneathiella sp. TaxID=879315 RepID=UPI0030EE5E7B|tara:strand:- start:7466 stop:8533 length:1068 start_codon:yes stop_codon:yes gene_type:complete
MKNTVISKLGLMFGGAAVAFSLTMSSASAEGSYPETKLKVAHALPETYVWSEQVDKWFFNELERRSDGKITAQIFWNGSLVGPKQVFDAVGSGAVPAGGDAQGYYPAALPLNTMPNALLGTLTYASSKQASTLTREVFEKFPEVQEEWKALGIWPLYFNAVPSFRVACTEPVATVKDLRGKKVRQFSAYHPKVWEAVDAVGVTVLPAEIYEGLQRGRIDCVFYNYSAILSQKMYEQANYVSKASFGAGSTWPIVVNYDMFFNEWSEDLRNLFLEVAKEAELRSVEVAEAEEIKALKAMEELGVNLVEFSPEEQQKLEEKLPDFIDIWIKQQEGTDRYDVAKRIGDYMKKRSTELN